MVRVYEPDSDPAVEAKSLQGWANEAYADGPNAADANQRLMDEAQSLALMPESYRQELQNDARALESVNKSLPLVTIAGIVPPSSDGQLGSEMSPSCEILLAQQSGGDGKKIAYCSNSSSGQPFIIEGASSSRDERFTEDRAFGAAIAAALEEEKARIVRTRWTGIAAE